MKLTAPKKLHSAACKARRKAHAPYSRFRVGAALSSDLGLFTGCNVENVSFGGTVCAERTAFLKAISEGAKKFTSIMIVTEGAVPPCALCLQTMVEFCGPSFKIYLADPKSIKAEYDFSTLLPLGFGPRKFP